MNTREIEELLEGHFPEDDPENEEGWTGWTEIAYSAGIGNERSYRRSPSEEAKAATIQEVEGLGTVTLVDAFTGEEGGPEHVWMIFKIDHQVGELAGTTKLYRKDGAHISHDGTHWDGDVYEVEAKQKTITVYDKAPKVRS